MFVCLCCTLSFPVCTAVECVLENVLMSTMLMCVAWRVYSAAMIHNDECGGERQS